jgi:hypothetical protein
MTSAAVWDAASLGQKCMQFESEVKASMSGLSRRMRNAGFRSADAFMALGRKFSAKS